VFSPSDPGRPDAKTQGCASHTRAISAMTRLIFVTQVLDPDDAVVGFTASF
jgi:hypothetical protein